MPRMSRKQFLATAAGSVGLAAKAVQRYPEQLFEIYPVPPLARRNDTNCADARGL